MALPTCKNNAFIIPYKSEKKGNAESYKYSLDAVIEPADVTLELNALQGHFRWEELQGMMMASEAGLTIKKKGIVWAQFGNELRP